MIQRGKRKQEMQLLNEPFLFFKDHRVQFLMKGEQKADKSSAAGKTHNGPKIAYKIA